MNFSYFCIIEGILVETLAVFLCVRGGGLSMCSTLKPPTVLFRIQPSESTLKSAVSSCPMESAVSVADSLQRYCAHYKSTKAKPYHSQLSLKTAASDLPEIP